MNTIHNKIINIIRFNGNIDLLDLKIKKTFGESWVFIPPYRLNGEKNLFDKKLFDLTLGNVKKVYIESEKTTQEKSSDYYYFLAIEKEIKKNLVDFEKIIMISDDCDFIDFSDFEKIQEKIESGPVILKHSEYPYNLTFRKKHKKGSSICFTLSQFLIQKNILTNIDLIKKNNTNFNDFSLDNGWSFPFCYDLPTTNSYNLVQDRIQNFEPLEKFEKKINPKKVLITESPTKFNSNYDLTVRLNFNKNTLKEKFEFVSEKEMVFYFSLPDSEFYSTKDNFIKQYKSNIIGEVLEKLRITVDDFFDIN